MCDDLQLQLVVAGSRVPRPITSLDHIPFFDPGPIPISHTHITADKHTILLIYYVRYRSPWQRGESRLLEFDSCSATDNSSRSVWEGPVSPGHYWSWQMYDNSKHRSPKYSPLVRQNTLTIHSRIKVQLSIASNANEIWMKAIYIL